MVVCKYFKQGNCKFGPRCSFEHPRGLSVENGNTQFGTAQQSPGMFSERNSRPDPPKPLAITAEVIKSDLTTERPMWPFTSYCPAKHGFVNLISAQDLSFEEVRLGTYQAISAGSMGNYEQELTSKAVNLEGLKGNILNNLEQAVNVAQESNKPESGNAAWASLNPSPRSSSLFGAGSTTVFGAQSQPTTSAFGQLNKPHQSSVFGQSTSANSPSIFGQKSSSFSQTNNPVSGFGQAAGTFGQASQPQSIFGQRAQSQSAFGQAALPQSVFGQTAQPQSAFGQTSQPQSAFGQTTQPQSAFGQTTQPQSAFGQISKPQSAFGQLSQPQSAFGQTSQPQSAFGQTTRPQPQTAFGQSAFGQPTQPQSPFAQTTQVQSSSPFGQTIQSHNTSPFSQPVQSQSVFGQASSTVSQPLFGSGNTTSGSSQLKATKTGALGTGKSPFGTSETQPHSGSNPFAQSGSGTTSAFGSSPGTFGTTSQSTLLPSQVAKEPTQQSSAFGKALVPDTTSGTSEIQSAFGVPLQKQSAFGSSQVSGQSAFGQLSTPGRSFPPSSITPINNTSTPSAAGFGSLVFGTTQPVGASATFTSPANPTSNTPVATKQASEPEDLPESLLAQFKAECFTIGLIPEVPPPRSLIRL